jgi:hypothetical protein
LWAVPAVGAGRRRVTDSMLSVRFWQASFVSTLTSTDRLKRPGVVRRASPPRRKWPKAPGVADRVEAATRIELATAVYRLAVVPESRDA